MQKFSVNPTEDIIDSRDVIETVNEAEVEIEDAREEVEDTAEALAAEEKREDTCADMISELRHALKVARANLEALILEYQPLFDFASEFKGYAADYEHGEAAIRDSYFVEYAEQMAEDIGAIGRNMSWPLNHIDWDAAADELKSDYTAIEFDGVTYWVR